MNYKFLVDVNLPKKFSYFNHPCFTYVVDLNPCMKDEEVWEYAKVHKMVILTKDADFSLKAFSEALAPKVIFFDIGNFTLRELHIYFEKNWNHLCDLLDDHSFILARRNEVLSVK